MIKLKKHHFDTTFKPFSRLKTKETPSKRKGWISVLKAIRRVNNHNEKTSPKELHKIRSKNNKSTVSSSGQQYTGCPGTQGTYLYF